MQKVMNGRSFCVHCWAPIKASGGSSIQAGRKGTHTHTSGGGWGNYNIHDDGTASSRGAGGVFLLVL